MRLRKRIFSLLLMLCMVVTLMPATYMATEQESYTFKYQCLNMYNGEFPSSDEYAEIVGIEVFFGNDYWNKASTIYAETMISNQGEYALTYLDDKYIYNNESYNYVAFYVSYMLDGVREEAIMWSDVKSLIELGESTYIFGLEQQRNTEILVKFMHGSAVLNAPCKMTEAQYVELGSQQYSITVDEEDITADVNGNLYLTTSLNEMFPDGVPKAPDHEVAGKFLGWYKLGNATELKDYCIKPEEEIKLSINKIDNSVSFTPVYDKKIENFGVFYTDEMGVDSGTEINDNLYHVYVDFPMTCAEKVEMAKNVTEILGLKHVQSFGEITMSVGAIHLEAMDTQLLPYGGTNAYVTFSYEFPRTDTTFDKTEYTFGLEDNTVVNGVEVKVSLCNSMDDANKVTIETSTSGQGEVIIEHIDDVIYYGNDTYEYIEVAYSLPEGYVIKDSDITNTTVWYTATEWCKGGGTYWLLEKLSEPEPIPEPESTPEVEIIIPDADAPAEEEVKVEVPVENPVISEDKMDDIIEANKKHPVKIETNDDVIIEFPAGGMKPVEGKNDYDFGVKIEKDYNKAHDKDNNGGQHVDENRKFKEDEFVLRINYNYSGELPGEAEISIPVGKEWSGKTLYYYQLMDDGSYHYTGQKGVVDENGYFRVKQGHCSDYVVVTQAPEEEGTAAHYTALMQWIAALNGDASTVVSPKTGDYNGIMYVMLLAVATACVVLIKNKRNA